MTSQTGCKLLDSSVWIEYLEGNAAVVSLVDGPAQLHASAVSVLEIRRKLLRERVPEEFIARFLNFIRHRAEMVDVDFSLASDAAQWSLKGKLSAIDAIIYASARVRNAALLTTDKDFEGLQGVQLVNS